MLGGKQLSHASGSARHSGGFQLRSSNAAGEGNGKRRSNISSFGVMGKEMTGNRVSANVKHFSLGGSN